MCQMQLLGTTVAESKFFRSAGSVVLFNTAACGAMFRDGTVFVNGRM